MRQDSTPAPEGETPPCQCGHALNQHLLAGGHCEQRGCACRLFVIPLPPARERGEATPAPASGETPAYCAKCGGFAGQHDCTPTPSRPEGETAKHHTLGYLNPTGLFRPNTTPQGCSPTPSRPEGETPLVETCPRCREVGACRCVPGLITPIPARPEGETARCSGCGDEYGHLGPCNPDPYMGSPTPAPASGEEELAWLRIRDVHQPQSGKSRCCGTWELVEPALLIAVRERDWILEAFARLTRELAEARARLAALTHRDQAYNSPAGIPQPIKGYESLPESIGVAVMCFSDEAVRYGLSLEVGDGSSHIAGEFLRGAAKELYDTLEREFDAARALAAAKGGA